MQVRGLDVLGRGHYLNDKEISPSMALPVT